MIASSNEDIDVSIPTHCELPVLGSTVMRVFLNFNLLRFKWMAMNDQQCIKDAVNK